MNEIYYGDELRTKLNNGVDIIAKAVSKTYGPYGRNVLIKNGAAVFATKDGATVAKHIHSNDPVEESAINIIRKIASKTAEDVGDGTTTATILANEIVKSASDIKNMSDFKSKLNGEVQYIKDGLNKVKKEISEYDDIFKVAMTSTNGDKEVSKLLTDSYHRVGKYGRVSYERTDLSNSELEFKSGFAFENGLQSNLFINNDKYQCVIRNVKVVIMNKTIETSKEILDICDEVVKSNKANRTNVGLLFLAEDFSPQTIGFLTSNLPLLNSVCVKLPYMTNKRKEFIQDIYNIFGEEPVCSEVIVDIDGTVMIEKDHINNTDTINEILESFKNTSLSKADYELNQKRLAGYTGGFCTIKVGGSSEIEMNEISDRIDDGIGAIKTALRDGVLPGGGFALKVISELMPEDSILKNIIQKPSDIIFGNIKTFNNLIIDQYADSELSNYIKFWTIKKEDTEIDLFQEGILDPYKVTITALENAVSAALMILTTECTIINNN